MTTDDAGAGPALDADALRHIRDTLAERTPGTRLWVNRRALSIRREADGQDVLRMVLSHWQNASVDANLDALSILWNCADELLADADALAGALAEAKRHRLALGAIRDAASRARVEWRHLPGIIERMGALADAALRDGGTGAENGPESRQDAARSDERTSDGR